MLRSAQGIGVVSICTAVTFYLSRSGCVSEGVFHLHLFIHYAGVYHVAWIFMDLYGCEASLMLVNILFMPVLSSISRWLTKIPLRYGFICIEMVVWYAVCFAFAWHQRVCFVAAATTEGSSLTNPSLTCLSTLIWILPVPIISALGLVRWVWTSADSPASPAGPAMRGNGFDQISPDLLGAPVDRQAWSSNTSNAAENFVCPMESATRR